MLIRSTRRYSKKDSDIMLTKAGKPYKSQKSALGRATVLRIKQAKEKAKKSYTPVHLMGGGWGLLVGGG